MGRDARRAAIVLLSCLLVLAGCELLPSPYDLGNVASDPTNTDAVFAGTTVSDDIHQRTITIQAPLVRLDLYHSYLAIAVLTYDENRHVIDESYNLGVYVFAEDWLFLDHAYSYGRSFPVTSNRKLVNCYEDGECLISEWVGITLTRNDLEHFAKAGFTFEVTGSGGSRQFSVPAGYFAGFLRRLALVLGETPQPASAPSAGAKTPPSSPPPSPGGDRASAARPAFPQPTGRGSPQPSRHRPDHP
ncbi:MAG: hypothetical protein D6740_12110 [Alphaproteobacteria bacterium]|nr:MAG: hypothetical protein D6740_12110 [Alphaproteobacteria bacterium]